MVEPLRVQGARLWFNAAWRSVPNADMSFHCQALMRVHIPITESNDATLMFLSGPNLRILVTSPDLAAGHVDERKTTLMRK